MSNENTDNVSPVAFRDLGLPDPMLAVLAEIGYETPSPIQAQTIPLLREGRDVLGQAQTGTGKTAAFALPLLARLDVDGRHPQVLVLAPTRELAIQVAEAFQTYARHLKHFHVLPIYGGTDYRSQLRSLKQGVQVVVGTPGRVMDHMRRGTLDLSRLQALVLDEADEMLRMGFIDDVEWILQQTPTNRQIALFSATMPKEIRRIAQQHLKNPAEITIAVKTTTAATIRQRYWPVSGVHKLDALTRILEAEEFDGMLVFVRTKLETVEVTDKLRARGYNAAALNGDIAQAQREKTVSQLKRGDIDILVATDVAARGLDVERISHVVNYDIPIDTEAYVHRIGRTGRAGRSGDAILFVSPREKRMLFAIEKATRQPIERMELPSAQIVNEKRIAKFKQKISSTLEHLERKPERLDMFRDILGQFQHETGVELEKIAAALAVLAQDGKDLLLKDKPSQEIPSFDKKDRDAQRTSRREREGGRPERSERGETFEHREKFARPEKFSREDRGPREPREPRHKEVPDDMERYRIEVGHQHNVKPGNIVGAIANEADLDSQYIGHIAIFDDYSTVDLPKGMPKETFELLRKTWVAGRPMNIARFDGKAAPREGKPYEKKGFEKKSFEKKPFDKKEGFNKDGFKKEGFKKDDFKKKDGFKSDGFKNKDGFKKKEFKKDGFRKDDFKKGDFKKKKRRDD